MSDETAAWLARRLGREVPPPAAPLPPPPSPYAPRPQQPLLPHQYNQPPQPQPGQKMDKAATSEALHGASPEDYARTIHKQAERDMVSHCPGCGGVNFLKRGKSARQVCFDCGYPNDHQGPN